MKKLYIKNNLVRITCNFMIGVLVFTVVIPTLFSPLSYLYYSYFYSGYTITSPVTVFSENTTIVDEVEMSSLLPCEEIGMVFTRESNYDGDANFLFIIRSQEGEVTVVSNTLGKIDEGNKEVIAKRNIPCDLPDGIYVIEGVATYYPKGNLIAKESFFTDSFLVKNKSI